MQKYILLCRSITHAQRLQETLERIGVRCRIERPPIGLSEKGCSYAVSVKPADIMAAMQHLREVRFLPERVFYSSGDGSYREILPR